MKSIQSSYIGVNFNQLKNNIGTFTDPKLVIIDKKYLETLDEKNLKSGYARAEDVWTRKRI